MIMWRVLSLSIFWLSSAQAQEGFEINFDIGTATSGFSRFFTAQCAMKEVSKWPRRYYKKEIKLQKARLKEIEEQIRNFEANPSNPMWLSSDPQMFQDLLTDIKNEIDHLKALMEHPPVGVQAISGSMKKTYTKTIEFEDSIDPKIPGFPDNVNYYALQPGQNITNSKGETFSVVKIEGQNLFLENAKKESVIQKCTLAKVKSKVFTINVAREFDKTHKIKVIIPEFADERTAIKLLDKILAAIAQYPSSTIHLVKEIRVNPQPVRRNTEEESKRVAFALSGQALASANRWNTIDLYPLLTEDNGQFSYDYLTDTFRHEMGHLLHFSKVPTFFSSLEVPKEWTRIRKNEPHFVSHYASYNEKEDFAEMVEAYLNLEMDNDLIPLPGVGLIDRKSARIHFKESFELLDRYFSERTRLKQLLWIYNQTVRYSFLAAGGTIGGLMAAKYIQDAIQGPPEPAEEEPRQK